MKTDFLPFEEFQKAENEKYYREKGVELYRDFSTAVSACSKLAKCTAREFYQFIAGKELDEINTCEIGIGNGNFTFYFVKELEKLDGKNNTDVCKRTNFILVDFSEKILENAKRKFKGIENSDFFTSEELLDSRRKLLYVRANELLSDLPTLILARERKNVLELYGKRANGEIDTQLRTISRSKYEEPGAMLKVLVENHLVPFNIQAMELILDISRKLDFENCGYIDIFDYGFNSLEEVNSTPSEVWNQNVFRQYGTQVTVDVNFPYIAHMLKHSGLKAAIEPQVEYMERMLKENLYQTLLDQNGREEIFYLSKEELKKYEKELLKKGYSDEFVNGGIKEEFLYYHFRITM